MSEGTEAPARPKKQAEPQDPDQFMAAAREQLLKQREEVEAKRTAIDEELAGIDAKLDRIESYFNPHKAPAAPKAPRKASGPRAPRQSGVRDRVLAKIAENKDGISRKDLLAAMSATTKGQEQSVSNAVAALKKDGKISTDQGHYRSV